MFLKKITKKDRKGTGTYVYYRLVHSYKVGDKNRQQTIINMGKLDNVPRESHKILADRIESILLGTENLLFGLPDNIEKIAQEYAKKIVEKGVFPFRKKARNISEDLVSDFQCVDINSFDELESLTIGGEWLVKQAFDVLKFKETLSGAGMSLKETHVALKLLTAKLLNPSSELETERWLKEDSGVSKLYQSDDNHIATRYRLYKAATGMFKNKDIIENKIYDHTQSLFSQPNTIVIYDLTNMYFEGQMLSSEKAKFGRSKQKRSGSRLISLALAIDSLGFIKYNKILDGNISEPGTFISMIEDIRLHLGVSGHHRPVVVMDAGITTEDNLEYLRNIDCDYVCVSRTRPSDYKLSGDSITRLKDNRGNNIDVSKITVENKTDYYLRVKSEQKKKKENSIFDQLTKRFEESLEHLKSGLSKPRCLKKTIAVHEKVGRLKKQFAKVAQDYDIIYTEDAKKGIITDIQWLKKESKNRPKGEYFLRYSKEKLTDKEIWDTYNMTRDVEAAFRCLKTDLNIRPIHHQKDAYIEPHIWLGLIAYQIVNYIKLQLKESNITYSWTTIVKKMSSQQKPLKSAKRKDGSVIYTQLVTQLIYQKEIYDALKLKDRPFVRKI